jgi:2',3'-cyclic-nucleotide 2'-phosphodiesterase (5'-nucleotidase family)
MHGGIPVSRSTPVTRHDILKSGWLLLFLLVLSPTWAREVPITILHTTDLHGRVEQLARCATLIGQTRASEKNVLLVDNGDTIQGTAASWLTGGELMARAMNALRYDAWVLGNHEFDWGLEKLTNCIARSMMPVLAANASGLARVQPFVIRDVDGVKVAIVGLTTPGIPNWSRPRLIPGLQFADSVQTLRKVLPAAREQGAQVFVLVAHQGYKEGGDDHANQLRAIAEAFPELDLIIGGHSHREFEGLRVARIPYTQAGFHGQHLGRADLVFDTDKRKVISCKSRLIKADAAPDETVLTLARDDLARAEKYLATPLGEAVAGFSARGGPKRETPVHNLICGAMAGALRRRGVKVDAVIHGLLDADESLAKGPVTVADVWRLVPYENTVGVVRLTAPQLREVLDENAGAYDKHQFRGVWGLRCRFEPRAPEGRRVPVLFRADGAVMGEGERLAVALNSYELASGGLRWKKLRQIADLPETGLVEYDVGTREALMEEIREQRVIAPRIEGWWDVELSRRRGGAPPAR